MVAKVINKGGNESGRKGSGLLHTPKRQQQPAGSPDRERKEKEREKKGPIETVISSVLPSIR